MSESYLSDRAGIVRTNRVGGVGRLSSVFDTGWSLAQSSYEGSNSFGAGNLQSSK